MKIKDIVKTGFEDIRKSINSKRYFLSEIERDVEKIIEEVYKKGDDALIHYTEKYDGYSIKEKEIELSENEIDLLSKDVEKDFIDSILISIKRVKDFHRHTLPSDWAFIDEFGNLLGQKYNPIERVGIYTPGGKAAYPSTIVMTSVIAGVAGVKNISIITPPGSLEPPSSVAATIKAVGNIDHVYRVGGVQGIAALAFGTETVEKVDKIVGPGNLYVTVAKKLLYGVVDIDMVAGPSEVLIIADGTLDVDFAAYDLIAQAEHDENARPICITYNRDFAKNLTKKIETLIKQNPRRDIIERSIEENGVIYLVKDKEEAIELANLIAPEHLEIQTEDPRSIAAKIVNAGAIFIGENSAEAFGDYISGPSHVLPTGGTARFFSPLNIMSFIKVSSIIEMSDKGSWNLGKYAKKIARAEGLVGHADSINIRRKNKNE